jgi:hypothetical protein
MTDRNERCPGSADKTVQDIGEATRRKFSAEEKIRIVLQSLHGEETIAEPTGHRLEAARTRVRRQDVGVLHTTAASLVVMGAARFHDGDALLQQLIHVQSLGLQRLAPRGHILG